MPAWSSLVAISALALLLTTHRANGQSDFETWAQQQQQRMQGFQQQQDKAFLDFLEQEWKRFEVFQGIARDTTPKPDQLPVAPPPPEMSPDAGPVPGREASASPVSESTPEEPLQAPAAPADVLEGVPDELVEPEPAASRTPETMPAGPAVAPLSPPVPARPRDLRPRMPGGAGFPGSGREAFGWNRLCPHRPSGEW